MKTARNRNLSRLLALVLATLMALTATAFAADDSRAQTNPPPYTIDRYGNVTITVSDTTVKTTWDGDGGCQIDTYFLSGQSLLRRLRLTFNSAYDLYDSYLRAVQANSVDAVLQKEYRGYGKLADRLYRSTIQSYQGTDGIGFLCNLRLSWEYRNDYITRWMVEKALADLEATYAPSLRSKLELFYPQELLNSLSLSELQLQAGFVVNTPQYIVFHNTLFGHDCSTVESLLKRGYSASYIAQLYSNQAKAAVVALWPNYQDLMNDYWRNNDRPW